MVKFISYNGSYPNLCSGALIIEIDGVIHKLKNGCLSSGGDVWFDNNSEEHVDSGLWSVTVPNALIQYKSEIEKLANENVQLGCCGGCV